MDFYIGTLMPFPYNFVTRGWMACNGQLLPIQQYSALFSLIGTYYGGNGTSTFALPYLNTTGGGDPVRAAMGQGNGPGLTPRTMGEIIGAETVTLGVSELPSHTHGLAMPPAASGQTATPTPPANGVLIDQSVGTFVPPGPSTVLLNPLTIAPAGQQSPHDNQQPWMSLYWCICYEGAFPPRP